jgi:beta-glucanase (GH16 family)
MAAALVAGVVVGSTVLAPQDAPAPAPTTATDAATDADTPMPVGDLPGWRQVYVEDFSQDAAPGSFPGPAYEGRWSGYEGFPDTSEAGLYSNTRVVSVQDGVMDLHLRTENGQPLVAAPIPLVHGRWGGQLYGRFEVRFRADPVHGYKTAWLLWPDSDDWAEGEIDFPEGPLSAEMYAANLLVGSPGVFDLKTDGLATFDEWHVATIEWTPDAVTFLLDGEQVGRSTSSPSTPMHWVLQTETDHGTPPADEEGHVEIDWVTVYEMG